MKKNDEKLLLALLTTSTISGAAEKAGVTEKTIRNRLSDNDFRAEYKRRQSMTLDAACKALQEAMTDAVDVLTDIMKETRASAANRISAARSVLEYGYKLTELTDLAARVAALEVAAKEAGR